MIRAAAYLRLSKDDGKKIKESDSIENQRRIIDLYLEKHPEIVLIEEYADDGYTGLNFERPGYKRMIKDVLDKKIDLILIKDFSRLGRRLNLVLNEIEKITDKKVNADIYSITEDLGAKKDSGDIKFSLEIMLNEHYSQNISKKIISEINAKHQLGMFIGSHTSYGYKRNPENKHHLIIDEYPASIVRRIFDEFLKGRGKQGIARDLNADGVLCPSAYKDSQGQNYRNSNRLPATNQWTYSTVNKVLQNQIYAGDMVQGKATYSKFKKGRRTFDKKDWAIVENTHEPIIDKELFFKVQELLQKNSRTLDFGNISLFAGFIKCKECGRALVKTANRGKITYVCSTYKGLGKEQCTRHGIAEDVLTDYILKSINSIALKYKSQFEELAGQKETKIKEQRDYKRTIRNLENVISKNENYKIKLLEKNADGIISDDDYKTSYQMYNSKIEQAKSEIQKISAASDMSVLDSFKNDKIIMGLINGKFETLTRDMLATYVESIIVSEKKQKLTITVNWKFNAYLT